jgi:peptidoglycan-associated lipoprotein
MTKKVAILLFLCALILFLAVSCKPKVKTQPPAPPPVKEKPKVEKVDEAAAVKQPALSEEEIFMSKSLEEVNLEAPLKMIHFDYDRYFIREDAKPALEANSNWLRKFKSAKILIEGHCDERGTEEYNLALGEKRAKSAFDYIVSLGIPQDRLKIISYGKSQPLDTTHNEISWQKNRRAQFLIIEK